MPFYFTPSAQSNTLLPSATVVFQGNYALTDANHNGIADSWEQQYFGSVATNRTRSTDSDGDGFTDYAEFMAGTNPTQTNSMLHLAAPVRQANGTMRLEWPSVAGRAYLVEGSTNGVNWSELSGWIPANSSLTIFTPPPAGPSASYLFRLRVRP